jgi:hypothetical protein
MLKEEEQIDTFEKEEVSRRALEVASQTLGHRERVIRYVPALE